MSARTLVEFSLYVYYRGCTQVQGQGGLEIFFKNFGVQHANTCSHTAYGVEVGRQFTISQVAKAAELPTTTVRYYERIGLVEPEDRSAGNYRLYGDESLQRLKFIRAAQAIGFTLDDVKALIGDGGGCPCCGDVQQLIEERLTDIDRRLKDLRRVQRVLKSALRKCQQSNPRAHCHVIDRLS